MTAQTDTLKIIAGSIGVILLGLSGYFLFEGLYLLSFNQGRWIGDYAFSIWGFAAFLLAGTGLWLILLSRNLKNPLRPENFDDEEQPPV